jgi:hypothetical protein
MTYIKENQVIALKLLAKYKYLTSSQFVKMGLYKRRGYLTNSLKVIIDMKKALIAKHDFNPLNGKLESFYYLTKYGKKLLMDELEYCETKIKAPTGSMAVYLKDYFHRKFTIDFYIQFNMWLELNDGQVIFSNYYFDKSGNNRSNDKSKYVTALNKIQLDKTNSFIPDINTKFLLNNKEYLFLFEQHNGKDTKRLFEQLCIHIIAISKDVVSKKYNNKKPHKVVVVCEYESVKKSVIQRLKKGSNIEHYNDFFIFKTYSQMENDFQNNWTSISGEKVNFYKI